MNKQRKKSTRHHGSHTHGRGFKKKARGSGHRGGVGMAGTGKRADQKKTLILGKDKKYFGKAKTLRKKMPVKLETINLKDLVLNLVSYEGKGIAKKSKEGFEITLKGYKILGDGDLKEKLKITASGFSKSAEEKIKSAGGDVILLGNSEEKIKEKDTEEK